jgi:hypothetical protein
MFHVKQGGLCGRLFYYNLFLLLAKRKACWAAGDLVGLFGLPSSSFAAWIRSVFFTEILPMPDI